MTIFDARGAMDIMKFNRTVIAPVANGRIPKGFVPTATATKYYAEKRLASLPLLHQPDEQRIQLCLTAIEGSPGFLKSIRPRPTPVFPAHFAGDFSFGLCAVFAQAFEDLTGEEAAALCADEIDSNWDGTTLGAHGYVHSLVPRHGYLAIDSWGEQPIDRIADRFGVSRWHLDRSLHLGIVRSLRKNSPERFAHRYAEAYDAIKLVLGAGIG
jgi:hypothetical protein